MACLTLEYIKNVRAEIAVLLITHRSSSLGSLPIPEEAITAAVDTTVPLPPVTIAPGTTPSPLTAALPVTAAFAELLVRRFSSFGSRK